MQTDRRLGDRTDTEQPRRVVVGFHEPERQTLTERKPPGVGLETWIERQIPRPPSGGVR
jgi:hypothetical protein